MNSPKNIVREDSSSFKFEIKPGDYQLFVSHTGYKTDTIDINVPLYFSGNYVSVNADMIPDKVFEGEFLSINNILFEFDSYELDEEAKSGLEVLRSILTTYPELKVEVAGYTDSKGSKEYNRKLADKRAQSVITYLSSSGTSASQFIKKAYGKSNFVAVNTNQDGSDNPEGRKYNRRVTFGIVDPKTGVVISQETYTPEHLRQPLSMRYSIVLIKTTKTLSPDYFSALLNDEFLFVRTIKSDSISMYALGVFYNKIEALKYLEYAREKGFKDAYLLNQYDLNKESEGIITSDEKKTVINNIDKNIYTIQLKATRNPLNITKIFDGINPVNES